MSDTAMVVYIFNDSAPLRVCTYRGMCVCAGSKLYNAAAVDVLLYCI